MKNFSINLSQSYNHVSCSLDAWAQPIKLTFLGMLLVCRIEVDIRLIICPLVCLNCKYQRGKMDCSMEFYIRLIFHPLFAETANTTLCRIECRLEFYIRLSLFMIYNLTFRKNQTCWTCIFHPVRQLWMIRQNGWSVATTNMHSDCNANMSR